LQGKVVETLLHQFKHPQGCTCQKNLNFLGEWVNGWTDGRTDSTTNRKKTISPHHFVARG